ncbi:hypothetical protein [Aestuariivita boseongensis]|uniref:hypothetical protein n=1 Tax=Aestuariivita boseongensis TaxID=1470562 RepID=UPI000680172F|nr:hypothetical protein [Aestuariivita boseongensis]
MRVEPHERGRLHVFAVNLSASDLSARFSPPETGADRLQPPADLLEDLTGATGLDPKGAELVPLSDLVGLGLSGYLTEGLDIPADAVAPAKRRLDALEGYALLLGSRAFQGKAFALGETASLTHIASFDQPGTDWSGAGPIPSQAAKLHSRPLPTSRAERYRSQRVGAAIFAVVMLALVALVWVLIT